MDKRSMIVLVAVVWVPLMAFVAWKWFKIFNSPDGERYMRRRIQGPYVPLSAEENAADEARKL